MTDASPLHWLPCAAGVERWSTRRTRKPGPPSESPPPPKVGWLQIGYQEWTCQVEQGHYGHPARKSTWLLFVGPKPPELIWGPAEQRLPAKRLAERGYESARRCGVVANMSSRQRQRTPHEFRDLLLALANHAQPQAVAC